MGTGNHRGSALKARFPCGMWFGSGNQREPLGTGNQALFFDMVSALFLNDFFLVNRILERR